MNHRSFIIKTIALVLAGLYAAALLAGFLVAVMVMIEAPVSGTSLNPARCQVIG